MNNFLEKMNIFKIRPVFLLVITIFLLNSCVANKKYERANNVVEEKLFRTDLLPKDSLSTGNISWKEIFTDEILRKYISKTLENNLDIRIALQNIISAEAYLKQSKSAYLPSISVGPDYTWSTTSLNSYSGQNLVNRLYAGQGGLTANISWEADIWGKLKSQEKAQLATYLGTVAAHQGVKSDLVASVASAYYQILMYDEQKKITEETIRNRLRNLETTKALKQAGILTEVAVQQSQALVYNAQASLINIDVQTKILENYMSFLMNETSREIERSNLNSQKTPENFELGYPVNLLSNRPDVMVAENNLINAFQLANSAKSQFYPSLRITGSAGLQSINVDNFFSASSLFANVVAGLAQPILNKRQIKTQYEVSLATQEKAYLNFRKTILNAGKEVSNALNLYNSQDQFIDLKQKELVAYQKSVTYSQELVNYGMANYLEVLNANANGLNTELIIANAKYTKLSAGVELYRAFGGGWR